MARVEKNGDGVIQGGTVLFEMRQDLAFKVKPLFRPFSQLFMIGLLTIRSGTGLRLTLLKRLHVPGLSGLWYGHYG